MSWSVVYSRQAAKQRNKLPARIQSILDALIIDIRAAGPIRGNWPNYSKLGNEIHHCHLKKGRPTYVAVWREDSQGIKLVELTYVGTHEKAPY
jgi:mRNA-degrading endonuclease RelE of RelBE toxin-antitoxin system